MGDRIDIYTDGSCNNHTKGPGGWAFACVFPNGKQFVRYGQIPSPTTNNVAELMAVYMALKLLGSKKLYIHSDSKYVVDGLTKYCRRWAEDDFVGVKNAWLWRKLYRKYKCTKAHIAWVKGHAGNNGNELADKWCGEGARGVRNVIKTDRRNVEFV